jgi:phage terminase large subunit
MKARKRVVQGGTSSGKTYGIVPILIDKAAKNQRKTITVVAESVPAVKSGALKIFQDVMTDTNRWFEDRYNATERTYTFSNKTTIQFTSFDSVGKAKAAGKRDILFLNEGNHIDYEIADALMIRSLETWIDFNPDEEFWAHTEVLQEPNSEFLLLKFTDNEALPPETYEDLVIKLQKAYYDPNGDRLNPENIKSAYWANWCRVYIDGEVGQLEGVVFSNWSKCNEIPKEAELISYGLDWGFTNDPTAIIEVYRYDGAIYVNELLYQTRLTNSEIISRLKQFGVTSDQCIVADSAEPKSIQDVSNAGFYIDAAKKGPDSIKSSIDRLQQYKIFVTSSSINLIKELRQYKWAKKDGKALNAPEDAFNHAIDALRYVALNKLSQFEASGEYSLSGDDDY